MIGYKVKFYVPEGLHRMIAKEGIIVDKYFGNKVHRKCDDCPNGTIYTDFYIIEVADGTLFHVECSAVKYIIERPVRDKLEFMWCF
jgi:hypothetical protein